MRFELLVGITFLLYILVVQAAAVAEGPVEHFGVFGCAKIPFDKALKDTKTPLELADYLKTEWNPKTTDEKNKMMNDWENMACENQNKTYDMLVSARQKRDTVDALATS